MEERREEAAQPQERLLWREIAQGEEEVGLSLNPACHGGSGGENQHGLSYGRYVDRGGGGGGGGGGPNTF